MVFTSCFFRFIAGITVALTVLQISMPDAIAQSATVKEEEQLIKTYPFSDPSPVPVLTTKAVIYPYHRFEGYSTVGKDQSWKVVTLENDYIQVTMLPEVGGKVRGAIEKATGGEFIYQNDVLKFRNIAMRGPWTSGGIEFNFGIIGHSPATATPVDYLIEQHEDGSVSCIVGTIDLPSRTQWRVRVTLHPDKAYFETNSLWYNPTPTQQSYYNWMTAAAEVRPDLEFYYPGYLSLEHSGEAIPWPTDTGGRALNLYRNNNFGTSKSYHVVGAYHHYFGGYWHDTQLGFGHWADHQDMLGQKLWLWAQSREGGIWEDLLTDTDGQYMEFQAGRLFNQYSYNRNNNPITKVAFAPRTSDRWRELWFPFRSIGGMTDASPTGVMHVEKGENQVSIKVNALSQLEDTVVVSDGERVIYRKKLSLAPMDTAAVVAPLPSNANNLRVEMKRAGLRYDSKEQRLQRPFAAKATHQLSVADQQYNEGVAAMRQRQYTAAVAALENSIRAYPAHYRARVALAEILYQQGKYDRALEQVHTALAADTYNYDANYVAGIIYQARGEWNDALESLGVAARSPTYRIAANLQMAEVALQQGNLERAEAWAKQALDYDQRAIGAYQVLAVVYRTQGLADKASEVVDKILEIDPLCHFARFEHYLQDTTADRRSAFAAFIRNEMPYQTYLEIAMDYQKMGQQDAARAALKLAPDQPLVQLWLAYLYRDQPGKCQAYQQKALDQSPAFVFPFRRETLTALTWADQQQDHWKTKYYLGLTHWAVGNQKEAATHFTACEDEPDYAPFYLARAALLRTLDQLVIAEEKDLTRALALDENEWRTWHALIDYRDRQEQREEAETLAKKAYQRFPNSYVLGMDYAKARFHQKQYQAAAKVLDALEVLPNEGASEGRTLFEKVYLHWAMKQLQEQRYAEAVKLLKTSLDWPEHLGVGQPYDPETRPQHYLLAHHYQQQGKTDLAQQHQNEVVRFTGRQLERSPYDLLGVLTLRQQDKHEEADSLLAKMKTNGDGPLIKWAAAYASDEKTSPPTEKLVDKDAYESLRQLLQITE